MSTFEQMTRQAVVEKATRILEGAAELLSQRSELLKSNAYVDPETGNMCIYGACATVAAGGVLTDWSIKAIGSAAVADEIDQRLMAVVPENGPHGGSPIAFNDLPETTVEDAVLLLKRAAAGESS